jgi:hypothetical protein
MSALKYFLTVGITSFAIFNLYAVVVTAKNVSECEKNFTAVELVFENLSYMGNIICSFFLIFGALKSKKSFLNICLLLLAVKASFIVWEIIRSVNHQTQVSTFQLLEFGETNDFPENLSTHLRSHSSFCDHHGGSSFSVRLDN